jgi:Flp pilus assembly protein TadG
MSNKFEKGPQRPQMKMNEKAEKGFLEQTDGNALVFGLCIFVVMLMSSGMAIDFMRHENQRVILQTALDRGVLAAADLEQTLDPTAVVNEYVKKAGLPNVPVNVVVDEGLIHRNVRADGATPVRSMFLNMLGINSIDAPAIAAAEERVNNVEISLVLDVSGSMGRTSSSGGAPKIHYLREAGQNFIDALLTPSTKDRISVSMVPYTGQTNAGAALMEYYNLDRQHNYSHCIEFEDGDFDQATISPSREFEQVQHFGWSNQADAPITLPMCSTAPQDEIAPFQNSNTEINSRIAAFEPRTNTAIHTAMKWAVEMLQPEFNRVVTGMIGDGLVSPSFAQRPVPFDDEETTKIIVLMTDGENVDQLRLPETSYETEADILHWANNPFYWGDQDGNYIDLVEVQDARNDNGSRSSADTNLHQICSVARSQGIIVFTIGFELGYSEHARDVLAACASSDAHAYNAEAVDLENTFSAVARTITQLRLTK